MIHLNLIIVVFVKIIFFAIINDMQYIKFEYKYFWKFYKKMYSKF
jgi:hypothetical protein